MTRILTDNSSAWSLFVVVVVLVVVVAAVFETRYNIVGQTLIQ